MKFLNEDDKTYIFKLLIKILVGFIAIMVIVIIIDKAKPSPQYEDFKTSIDSVMELNKPIVFEHKTTKKAVKIYFNSILWKEMSTSERVNAKQRLNTVVQTVGHNSGYIPKDKKINVIFYNDN